MAIIRNIFLNTEANKLRLANIVFDNKIKDVEYLSDEIDWAEVNSKKKLELFTQQHNLTTNPLLLVPGGIDPHVHFNTPGFEFRDDFEHASTAAAYGGVTTVIDMPCTSIPPVTSVINMNRKLEVLKNRSLIDYALWGGIRRDDFESGLDVQQQVEELNEAGVAAFKIYLISGMSQFKDLNHDQIKSAMKYVSGTAKPLGVHAEDKELIVARRDEYQNSNINTWEAYCSARNSKAEEKAILDLIALANSIDVRVHVVHLSSKAGLEQIRTAQELDLSFTSETCPHYLFFTQKNFENSILRNYLKTAPPVKFKYDLEALWDGLKNNTLSFITTDHAGCDPHLEKTEDNFWKVYGGIPGVEHRVPFLFSKGFLKNRLSLEQTIKLLSTNVAKYFGLEQKGSIESGKDADLVLVNLWKSEKVLSENMHSKGKYTPFQNNEFEASVERTYLRGKIVAARQWHPEVNMGYGNFLPVHLE